MSSYLHARIPTSCAVCEYKTLRIRKVVREHQYHQNGSIILVVECSRRWCEYRTFRTNVRYRDGVFNRLGYFVIEEMARGRPDVAATRHQLQKRGTRVSNIRAVISRATGELAEIGRETKDVGKRQMCVEQIRGKEQTRR